jgi:hypothetical protein
LPHRLYNTDIRQGDFKDLCLEKLSARFQQLRLELRIKNDVSEFFDVHDNDLGKKRRLAKKLWPFVKVFTISTGHIILRYGMCLYDLPGMLSISSNSAIILIRPGWNDTNQLRTAHINDFRRKADLELIVAESSRIESCKTLERNTDQSIHLRSGPDRTILIMNKSDVGVCLLMTSLEATMTSQLQSTIAAPWTDCADIVKGIEDLFITKWTWPHIPHNSWAKMLRENGIPINGVYFGENFNEDVGSKVSPNVNEWADAMTEVVDPLAQSTYQPVEALLAAIQLAVRTVRTCTAVPDLMEATLVALADVVDGIETTFDEFKDHLQSSLDENVLRFTTEMDVECPIAQAMKLRYKRALDRRLTQQYGKGVYKRQREVLKAAMFKPKRHHVRLAKDEHVKPLVEGLKKDIVSSQRKLWKKDCTSFITDVIEQLEGFMETTEELLMDADFMITEHHEARKELKGLLVYFDASLIEVQNEIKDLIDQPPAKKVKIEEVEEPGVLPDATGLDEQTSPSPSEPSVPIKKDFGWYHVLANMHPLRSG